MNSFVKIISLTILSFSLGWGLKGLFNKDHLQTKDLSPAAETLEEENLNLEATPSSTLKKTDNEEGSVSYEYHLQLGAFKTPYFATQLSKKVKKRGYTVITTSAEVHGEVFTVVEVGPFKTYKQAQKHQKFLMMDNIDLGKILIKKRIND